MLKGKSKNRLILVGIILPTVLIITLIIISMLSKPIVEVDSVEKIEGKEINIIDTSIYGIIESPFIIEGNIAMDKVADIYFDFHIKRFESLTDFEVYLNGDFITEAIDDTDNIKFKIDKIDVKEGSNQIKIIIKDSSRGGGEYPSFIDYPLTVYSDSKIISEEISSAEFEVTS